MKRINKPILTVTILDFLRFVFIALFLLPMIARSLSSVGTVTSSYRLLLWLSAPQLILPVYMGAVAFGFVGDSITKTVGIAVKILSLAVGVGALIGMIIPLIQIFDGENTIILLSYIGIALLFDLLLCIILLAYKRNSKQNDQRINYAPIP